MMVAVDAVDGSNGDFSGGTITSKSIDRTEPIRSSSTPGCTNIHDYLNGLTLGCLFQLAGQLFPPI